MQTLTAHNYMLVYIVHYLVCVHRVVFGLAYVIVTSTIEYDYVPPPTEVPHRYGNIPSGDPLTTENSSYGLEEEEQISKRIDTIYRCA